LNAVFKLKLKNAHFQTYVYMTFSRCFGVNNSLFNFVQIF